jgi:aspartate aminotransferase-like enzyme
MESAVVNLVEPGDTVIVASCGNFGERWVKLNALWGAKVVALEHEWGTKVDPERVRTALAAHPEAKAVFCQFSETSTGVVNDIRALGEVVATTAAVFVVDAISGLGATDLPTDAWKVDVCVAGSQKALMVPPGLAYVAISEKAWKRVEGVKTPRFYFDWVAARKKMAGDAAQTPYTPAVSLMVAQNAAINLIREEGLPNVFARHRVLGRACKEGVKALGLELFGPDDSEANSVTAVKVPAGVDGKKIGKLARDRFGVWLAGGQGKLAGQIFRFGHCGYFVPTDIIVGLGVVEMVLAELGYDTPLGAGVAAAQRVFMEAAQHPERFTGAPR